MPPPATITRFAPSPSGHLHLGHLHAALEARRHADEQGGEMRLRIEDIDTGRCDPAFTEAIYEDLDFMEIAWDGEVMVQSERMPDYAAALDRLKAGELIYPCFLSRRELDALLTAPHQPVANTDRLIDQGLAAERREQGDEPAWRLRMEAIRPLIGALDYNDRRHGRQKVELDAIADTVIARKDIATSYHLSVVVDDAAQGVTVVTRGADLIASTPIHRLLQVLLDLPETDWLHHDLVLDDTGRRLSKRFHALSIRAMRATGMNRTMILEALASSPKA